MRRVAGVLSFLLVANLLLPMALGAGSVQRHSHYLFVWAMEAQHPNASTLDALPGNSPSGQMVDSMGLGKDFISVFDCCFQNYLA
jgi:hypothetical protein